MITAIYLLTGLLFAAVFSKVVTKMYDDYENDRYDAKEKEAMEPVLEHGYRLHSKIGNKAFWLSIFIMLTVFWAPVVIFAFIEGLKDLFSKRKG